jgi:site-specific DNA-methyltransferase (adenine-specific)/site-specific DNA-methyltransferase (cytosine-N4-specific)
MEIKTDLFIADSNEMLKRILNNSIERLVTSSPYVDQCKETYGSILPDKYGDMFLFA